MATGTTDGFTKELDELLSSAQAKAAGWIGQRDTLVSQLTKVRDAANKLLGDLVGQGANGHHVDAIAQGGPIVRMTRMRRRGRAKVVPASALVVVKRKRKKMSAAARKKISLAQKARWKAVRAGK